MKIGIFSIGLDGLKYLKATARELPEYNFELYADTRKNTSEALKIERVVEEGVKELLKRQTGLIIVLEESHKKAAEKILNAKIILSSTPNDLKNYLANNPELEKYLSKKHTRNITLTENTPETDETIATILGGTLIRE